MRQSLKPAIVIALIAIALLNIPYVYAKPILLPAYSLKYITWDGREILDSQLNLGTGDYPYKNETNSTYWNYRADTDVLSLNRNLFDVVHTYPTKISFDIETTKGQVANKSVANGTGQRYITIPQSLLKLRYVFDNKLPDILIDNGTNQWYANSSTYWYSKVDGDVRFNFNTSPYSSLNNNDNITFKFKSFDINNATTSGWTANNTIFSNMSWTGEGGGSLAPHVINTSGLVAYWSFGETSGTILHNTNNENGTINSTNQGTWYGNPVLNSTLGIAGMGNALQFDGVNDYVDISPVLALNGNPAGFAVESWIKTGNGDAPVNLGRNILFHQGLASDRIGLGVSSGKLSAGYHDGAYHVEIANTTMNDNLWHHAVYVYTGSNSMTLYLDGVADGIVTLNPIEGVASSCDIGMYEVTGDFFNGSIDEVRIWNRALSAAEVSAMYNASFRNYGNITFLNQTASAGKIITGVRFNVPYLNSLNNTANISVRQNGTTTWKLFAESYQNWTYINKTIWNGSDILFEGYGNGSSRMFLVSGEVEEGNNLSVTNTTNQSVNEGQTAFVDIDGSGASNDTLTFSTNRTDLFSDFNTTNGRGNWTTNSSSSGTYYMDFGLSNGFLTTNYTMTITVSDVAAQASSGTSGGSSISPLDVTKPEVGEVWTDGRKEVWTDGRKDYPFAVIFEGKDGRVEPLNSNTHGITALNMLFKTPTTGTYTITISTYTDYKPRLNGSLKYFSITPSFGMKQGSSIEIVLEGASKEVELYQLYSDKKWKKISKGTKLSKDKYRFPVTSFGTFAVKQAGQEITANIVQAKKGMFGIDFSQAFRNVQERDRNAYEALKIKLAWLVEVVEKIKALLSEKLNTLS